MNVLGIAWAGTRTDHFEAMRTFLIDRFGLQPSLDLDDFSVFDLPNGDRVEVFGETMPANEFFALDRSRDSRLVPRGPLPVPGATCQGFCNAEDAVVNPAAGGDWRTPRCGSVRRFD